MTKRRDIRPTRQPNRGRKVSDQGGIYDGTVGWEDGKDHFDIEREGVPLVKVTLFRGHNPVTEGENRNPSRAKGRRILVRPTSSELPNDGDHVMVAIPVGRSRTPGAGMILGIARPDQLFVPNRKSGDKVIMGDQGQVIRMRADGSVMMFTRDSENPNTGRTVYAKLHRKGWEVRHPHGRATCDDLGFQLAHSSGASIAGGALGGIPAPLDVVNSFLTLRAAMVRLDSMVNLIGPTSAAPETLMKATPTLGVFTAMQAALTALATWAAAVEVDLTAIFTAVNGPPGTHTSTAPVATLGTAIGASGTAVTAVATSGPTRSLSAG